MDRRFDLGYSGLNRVLLTLLGFGPGQTFVTLDGDSVHVRFGRVFHVTFPRADVVSAAPFRGRRLGVGVHGWAGHWTIQTASRDMVRLRVRPAARGWLGVVPVRVEELLVSVADAGELLGELARPLTDAGAVPTTR